MLADAAVPGTDDWWLVRVAQKLGDNLPRMERLRSYRDGDALLPDNAWDAGTRDSYRRFVQRSRLHVVETIRDTRTNRQKVVGFRTAAEGDENGDELAWDNWNRSRMSVMQRKLFNDVADYGEAFIVTLPEEEENLPVFLTYDGWNAAVEVDPQRPWRSLAGVTYGYDPLLQVETVVLFRPGYYRIATRPAQNPSLPKDGTAWNMGTDWDLGPTQTTGWTLECAIRRIATPDGYGIWEKHIDHVDRINEITLNAITLIVMQSFRQRGIQGNLPTHYPEGHPQAGEEIDYDTMFEAGPAALWMLPMESKIWESQVADVRPIYEARKEELQALCSITRTPQDIFNGSSNNQSALGAEISREPLKFAIEAMNDVAAATFAEAQADAFRILGDETRADASKIETLFQKAVPATLAEKADASGKAKGGGASQRYIDEEIFEMTPAQRRQAEADRTNEAFTVALSGATGASTAGQGFSAGAGDGGL